MISFKDSQYWFPRVKRVQVEHLLHHFIVNTSTSLASSDDVSQAVWPSATPQLVTSHPFVLNAVLAISSLHISRSTQDKSGKQSQLSVAASQLNGGLSQYQDALQVMSESNVDALFAFSTILTAYILATAGDDCLNALNSIKRSGREVATKEAVRQIVRILSCLRGTKVIVVPCWELIIKGLLSVIAKRDWWPLSRFPATAQAIEEDEKLHALEKMWINPGRRYEYYFDTLELNLKSLRESFALVSQLTDTATGTISDWVSAVVWPIQLSTGFISSLESFLPEAWVILSHYAILPSRIQSIWWLESIASNIIKTAALVLGEDKWSMIEWPASIVGVDLDQLRSSDSTLERG
ncbi:hypothetical protein BDV96DRAFT_485885 [Lophiotrema nucula]|uniref:Uncharacterized protein n=1 Tax=Lophiotrema nucula TaxID=690887 RepID=A0A6A5ZLV3_9PLEO|nr:hypothetical protein BDV96DRAFT_485885 [Lophiotrema nucula]